jgi:hypothetical protein
MPLISFIPLIILNFQINAEIQKPVLETYIVSFKTSALSRNQSLINNKQHLLLEIEKLKSEHLLFIDKMNRDLKTQVQIIFNYTVSLNAISIQLSDQQAKLLSQYDEVKAVTKQNYLKLATDATASMINAETLWSGVAIQPLPGVKGEDILIAVIDSGINMTHISFSDTPEDGYDFASHNPFGADTFIGWCDPSHPNYSVNYSCNNKLVGAWDYIDAISDETDGPIDTVFHGTTMSGIISGNYISAPAGGFESSIDSQVIYAPFISGIAPHSHIIMYDACTDTQCPSSAVLAAIEQAIIDNVDIINLSIENNENPWAENSISQALLEANNLGILTSTSAGNATAQQPTTYARVGNLAPWNITAANSFHGRTESNNISITSPLPIPEFLTNMFSLLANGVTFVADVQASIKYSADVTSKNVNGCSPWPALEFDASIALIPSYECDYETKIQNAEDAGAIAVIIINSGEQTPIIMTGISTPTIPAVMIGQTDADLIISFIQENSASNPTVQVLSESIYRIVNDYGLVIYHSSLVGPNQQFNITKPDIAAPGTNIYAAIADLGLPPPQFYDLTGTSQSAAAMTGGLVLLKNIRPSWSPSALKSVVMTSAANNFIHENNVEHNYGDPTTTDDVGSGLVNLGLAANTVLVLDETYQNYQLANPNTTGDPKHLNLASMRDNNCEIKCSWMRTFTNMGSETKTWSISFLPAQDSTITASISEFSLAAEESISIQFEFSSTGGTIDEYRFADVLIEDISKTSSTVRLTMAVKVVDDLIFTNGFDSN